MEIFHWNKNKKHKKKKITKKMDPTKVKSPKNKIHSDITVVIQEKDFTIAIFTYGKSEKIGIRWNTTHDSEKGYPQSHGYPTWFILPKNVALSYAKEIGDINAYTKLSQLKDFKM